MALLLVRDDKVVNILPEAPPEGWELPDHIVVDADAQIGWVRVGGVWQAPALPRAIPDLSPRQLWIGLMTEEIITPAECEAASLGVIPAFIENVIAALPSDIQRATARVTIRRGLSVERDNALVTAALATLPVPPTNEAVDQFFLSYSQV